MWRMESPFPLTAVAAVGGRRARSWRRQPTEFAEDAKWVGGVEESEEKEAEAR
jgi:hypothetical protein